MNASFYMPPMAMQLVELKNGETYNGHMVQCDSWMNVRLREVICTSKVGGGLLNEIRDASKDSWRPYGRIAPDVSMKEPCCRHMPLTQSGMGRMEIASGAYPKHTSEGTPSNTCGSLMRLASPCLSSNFSFLQM